MPWTPTVTHHSSRSSYWDVQSLDEGTVRTEAASNQPSCWRLQNRFTRTTPTGTREDVTITTMHIAKNPGAGVRVVGVTSELAALETFLDTFWTAQAGNMDVSTVLAEYRWFKIEADDPLSPEGYPIHGPPVRVTGKNIPGVGTGSRTADQIASTYTLKTAGRKHWGRGYMPGLSRSVIDTTYGRFTTSYTDNLSLLVRNLTNSLAGAAGGVYELGVWSPRGLAFLNTASVQVDNIPDVQRRRRAKQASYFKRYTA